jgi:hypothetical protein
LNLQPSGYEPDELPIAPPRDIIFLENLLRFNFGSANITIHSCDVNLINLNHQCY